VAFWGQLAGGSEGNGKKQHHCSILVRKKWDQRIFGAIILSIIIIKGGILSNR